MPGARDVILKHIDAVNGEDSDADPWAADRSGPSLGVVREYDHVTRRASLESPYGAYRKSYE